MAFKKIFFFLKKKKKDISLVASATEPRTPRSEA